MKYCPECGNNVEGMKFCSKCGADLSEQNSIAKNKPVAPHENPESNKIKVEKQIKSSNNKLIVGVVIAFVVIMLLSGVNRAISGSSTSTASTSSKVSTAQQKEPSEADFKAACVVQPYNDLARTPDAYKNMKIIVTGKVAQVMEKSNGAQYRIAVDGNYGQMFYADYTGTFDQGRILEEDTVTLWGTYDGLMSYNSTLGGKITVPSLIAKYYKIN